MTEKNKRFDIRDKLKASKALRYEWWMLNECSNRIQLNKNQDKIINNALIEAFCVHLRNFIEFFYRKQKRGKRPFYTDYTSNKTIQFKHKLNKHEDKVNNLLSHLTYKRLNYTTNTKEWNTLQIANEVNENMFQFLDVANKNLLCDEIRKYLKQLSPGNKAEDNPYVCTTSNVVSNGTLVSAPQISKNITK